MSTGIFLIIICVLGALVLKGFLSSAKIGILNNMNPAAQAAGLGTELQRAQGWAPVTEFYTDGTNGDDTSDGLSQDTAFKTLATMMLAAAALGTRGRFRGYVAPGGYAENVVTPLNTECPFGQLIAWNPTPGGSFGACWIQSATPGEPALTVRARGWLVQGFEIAAVANTEAIHLDGTTANSNAGGFELRDCIVTGWDTAGSNGIDVTKNGAPYTKLINCRFDGLLGSAIICSESGTDQPRFWEIIDCVFRDNANHINLNPRGMKESIVQGCKFMQIGANRTATKQLDNRGGNATVVTNCFLSGTYDGSAGGYYDGTNAEWGGNWNIAGLTAANPA